MDLYIFKNGQTIGPLTPEQARTGLQSGQFNLSDKAITQSISDWTTLEEVLKLLDIRADFGHAPASVSSTILLPSPLLGTPAKESPKGIAFFVKTTDDAREMKNWKSEKIIIFPAGNAGPAYSRSAYTRDAGLQP